RHRHRRRRPRNRPKTSTCRPAGRQQRAGRQENSRCIRPDDHQRRFHGRRGAEGCEGFGSTRTVKEFEAMVLKVILFLLMLGGWPLNAEGRLDFSYLRAWIGRYPTDKTSKPQKSLFDLSDIQLPLKEI